MQRMNSSLSQGIHAKTDSADLTLREKKKTAAQHVKTTMLQQNADAPSVVNASCPTVAPSITSSTTATPTVASDTVCEETSPISVENNGNASPLLDIEQSPDAVSLGNGFELPSGIERLISEYQAALKSGDATLADKLGASLKAALGLHEDTELVRYLPDGETSRGDGTVSNMSNRQYSIGSLDYASDLPSISIRLADFSPPTPHLFTAFSLPHTEIESPVSFSSDSTLTIASETTTQYITGSVTDGLIRGATVFIDSDDDLQLDGNEVYTTTDNSGNFSLPDQEGTIVAYGGVDIATGLDNETIFSAPSGYRYLSPVTTVIQSMVTSGATVEEAEAAVSGQYGLTGVDLKSVDPIGDLNGSKSADALLVLNKSVQTANTASQIAALITGASISLTRTEALSAAYNAIAQELSSGGSLANQASLDAIIDAAACSCGVDVSGYSPQASNIMVGMNSALDGAAANGQSAMEAAVAITRMAKLAQGTISIQLQDVVRNGNPASMNALANSFTGENLVDAFESSLAGDVDGDGQAETGGVLNTDPTVAGSAFTLWGSSVHVASLFQAVDAENQDLTYYIKDSSGNGFLSVDGTGSAGTEESWIQVTQTQFESMQYIGGAAGSAETLSLYVEDSLGGRSSVETVTVNTSGISATSANMSLVPGETISAASFVTVENTPDSPLTYWVMGDVSGSVTVDGVVHAGGQWINVGTSLDSVTYTTGDPAGKEQTFSVKVQDAQGGMSPVAETVIASANRSPVMTSQASISGKALGQFDVSSLFSATDPDADSLTYQVKIESGDGSFALGGSSLSAADSDGWYTVGSTLDGLVYSAGNPAGGTETLYARVIDSSGAVSDISESSLLLTNRAPALHSVSASGYSNAAIALSGVVTVREPENDAHTFQVRVSDGTGSFYLETTLLEDADVDGWITVGDSLENLFYVAGNPADFSESIEFRAIDSFGNVSEPAETSITLKSNPPQMYLGPAASALANGHVEIANLFSAQDPEGDAMTYYVRVAEGAGSFTVDGVPLVNPDADGWFAVGASLAGVGYIAGNPVSGVAVIDCKAVDEFGSASGILSNSVHVTNLAPKVTAASNLSAGAFRDVDLSTAFSVLDSEGDTLSYEIRVVGGDGVFTVDGAPLPEANSDGWRQVGSNLAGLKYRTGNPSDSTETVVLRAVDSFGNVSNEARSLIVVSNDAPLAEASGAVTGYAFSTVDISSLFSATDTEGDALTFEIRLKGGSGTFSLDNTVLTDVDADGWVTVGSALSGLTYVAGNPDDGVETLEFRAIDGFGNISETADGTITVVNRAPVSSAGAGITLAAFESKNIGDTFSAADAESDSMTYEIRSTNNTGSFSLNGVALSDADSDGWYEIGSSLAGLTYTAGNPSSSEDAIAFRAVDALGNVSDAVLAGVGVTNASPDVTGPETITVSALGAVALDSHFAGVDIENDVLTYEVRMTSGAGRFSLNGTPLTTADADGWITVGNTLTGLSYIAGNPESGTEGIELRVTDSFNNVSNTLSTDIIVENQRPAALNGSSVTATANSAVDISGMFGAVDPESDELEYEIRVSDGTGHFALSGVSLSDSDGDGWYEIGTELSGVTYTAGNPDDGTEEIAFRAVDAFGNASEEVFGTVTVNNLGPSAGLNSSPSGNALSDVDISGVFSATDPEGDGLTYQIKVVSGSGSFALDGTPLSDNDGDGWYDIGSSLAGLSYTAGNPAGGEEIISFRAIDSFSNISAAQEATVSLINRSPSVSYIGTSSGIINTPIDISTLYQAVDPESDTLYYMVKSSGDGSFAIGGTPLTDNDGDGWYEIGTSMSGLTYTPGATTGVDDLTFMARDSFGNTSASSTSSVTIAPDGILIVSSGPVSANALSSLDISTLFTATDPQGDPLTYELRLANDSGSFLLNSAALSDTDSDGWYEAGSSLANLEYVAGNPVSGTEQIHIRVSDNNGNTGTASALVNISNQAPVTSSSHAVINANALGTVDLSSVFSVTDPEGDSLDNYWVKTDSDTGYFTVDGVTVNAGGWVSINPAFGTLTYSAGNPLDGTEQLQFKVSDSFGNVSNTTSVDLALVNQAPVSSFTQAAITVDALSPFKISDYLSFADAEADSLERILFKTEDDALVSRWVWDYNAGNWREYDVDCDDWTDISPSFSNLYYTSGNPVGGVETLYFRVLDDHGNYSAESTLTINIVNNKPEIEIAGTLEATALVATDVSGGFIVTDPESDSVTYEFKVTDGSGFFSLNNVQLEDSDSDGWYEAASLVGLTYTAGNPASSEEVVAVRATDSFGNVSDTVTATVNVINQAPALTPDAPSISINAFGAYDLTNFITLVDPEGDAITDIFVKTSSDGGYFQRSTYVVDADDWFRINPTFASLYYHPANPVGGEETLYFKAADSKGNMSDVLAVSVDVINRAPTVSANFSSITVDANGVYSLDGLFTISDPENDTLNRFLISTEDDPYISRTIYTADCDSVTEIGASFTNLLYNAGNPADGTESFTFAVRDIFGNVSNTVTVDVNVLNHSPVMSGESNFNIYVGETIDLTSVYSALDPESDELTYSLFDNAAGASGGYFTVDGVSYQGTDGMINIGANWDTITWTAGNPLSGTEEFTVIATDTHGNSGELDVTVDVNNTAPKSKQTTHYLAEESTALVSSLLSFSDREGDALSYQIFDATAGKGAVSLAGVVLGARQWHTLTAEQFASLSYTAGAGGEKDTLYIKADDGHGNAPVSSLSIETYHSGTTGIFLNPAALESRASTISFAEMFSVLDPEHAITSYAVMDLTSGKGTWDLNGEALSESSIQYLSKADLDNLTFRSSGFGESNLLRVWGLDAEGAVVMDSKTDYGTLNATQSPISLSQDFDTFSPGSVFTLSDNLTIKGQERIAGYTIVNRTADAANGTVSLDGVTMGAGEQWNLTVDEFERLTIGAGAVGSALSVEVTCQDVYGASSASHQFDFTNVENSAPWLSALENEFVSLENGILRARPYGSEEGVVHLASLFDVQDMEGDECYLVFQATGDRLDFDRHDPGMFSGYNYLTSYFDPSREYSIPYSRSVDYVSGSGYVQLPFAEVDQVDLNWGNSEGVFNVFAIDEHGNRSETIQIGLGNPLPPVPVEPEINPDFGRSYLTLVDEDSAFLDIHIPSGNFKPADYWKLAEYTSFPYYSYSYLSDSYDVTLSSERGIEGQGPESWGQWEGFVWNNVADITDVLPGDTDVFTLTLRDKETGEIVKQDSYDVTYYENTVPEITVLENLYIFSDNAAGAAGITLDQLFSVSASSYLPTNVTIDDGYATLLRDAAGASYASGTTITADQLDQYRITMSSTYGRADKLVITAANPVKTSDFITSWEDHETIYVTIDQGVDCTGGGYFRIAPGLMRPIDVAAENDAFLKPGLSSWLRDDRGIDHWTLDFENTIDGHFVFMDTGETIANGATIGLDRIEELAFVADESASIGFRGTQFTLTAHDILGNTGETSFSLGVEADELHTVSQNYSELFMGDYIAYNQMITVTDAEMSLGCKNLWDSVRVYDSTSGVNSTYFQLDGQQLAARQWHSLTMDEWHRLRLYGGMDGNLSNMKFNVIDKSGQSVIGSFNYSTVDDDLAASARTTAEIHQYNPSVAYKINNSRDKDWIKADPFDAVTVFTAEGSSTFGSGLVDPYLSLYGVDSSGRSTLLISDDNSGNGKDARIVFDRNEYSNYADYYLEVSGNGGAGAYVVSASATQQLSGTELQGRNLSMWHEGSGANLELNYNLFDIDFNKEFDWGIRSAPIDFNATPYVNFDAYLGAELIINSGTMDLSQSFSLESLFADDVSAGSSFALDTSTWRTYDNFSFSTTNPTFEFFLGFDANIEAGIKDIWFDVPFKDKTTLSDITLFDSNMYASIIDISSEGVEIPFLGLEFEAEIEEELGALSFEASIPEFGDVETTTSGSAGTNLLQSLTAVGVGERFATLGLDLDAIAQAAFGSDDLLSGDIDFSFIEGEYTIFDLAAEFGIKPSQKFDVALDSNDLQVSFATYASYADAQANNVFQTISGNLGDVFELQTPDGDGQLYIDAIYDFGGTVTNHTGFQMDGGFNLEMLGLQIEGDALGVGFDWGIGPLVEYAPTWDIGNPIYFYNDTNHYDTLMSATQRFVVDYHDRDDLFFAVG